MADITPADVEAYRHQRTKKNGEAAKLQTVNNDHIILKRCLNVARRHGLLVVNPASLVSMPDAQNERDRVLTADEWKGLFDAADQYLKPVILVAYHLGQRASEILNLTWDRVDLQRGFITLKSIDTKTKKPRQLPMTPAVKVALQELSKVRSLAYKNVFVKAGQPYTYEQVRRAFKKAVKAAGIQDLRFHDLRHCAATNLRRAGIDTTIAMQIIGHKSAHMWKRYNTVAETDLRDAANRLNLFLSNTVITPAELDESGSAATA